MITLLGFFLVFFIFTIGFYLFALFISALFKFGGNDLIGDKIAGFIFDGGWANFWITFCCIFVFYLLIGSFSKK
ncbi:hypothetical protein ACFYKT_19060 [Cytobacillus sp. FJAT-53684]|uniref:Uncharacterized protein n=1 Tax=Cytobacillus mangrovibacter TaxID=3299024 RepID=A0ABW6K2K0_9BACI